MGDDVNFLVVYRDEEPPPNDEELIQIEGFGSYRPMQFADPSHPASQRIGWPASKQSLKGTSLFVKDGHIYTNFDLPQKKSIEQQRRAELEVSIDEDRQLYHGRRQRKLDKSSKREDDDTKEIG